MSITYNGEHSIDIIVYDSYDNYNNVYATKYNTWKDWHLVPASRPYIAFSQPNINITSIPGTNRLVDMTDSAAGGLTYAQRSGQWDFIIDHDKWGSWENSYHILISKLNGKKVDVALQDDPSKLYSGVIQISNYEPDQKYSRISLQYVLQYDYYTISTGYIKRKYGIDRINEYSRHTDTHGNSFRLVDNSICGPFYMGNGNLNVKTFAETDDCCLIISSNRDFSVSNQNVDRTITNGTILTVNSINKGWFLKDNIYPDYCYLAIGRRDNSSAFETFKYMILTQGGYSTPAYVDSDPNTVGSQLVYIAKGKGIPDPYYSDDNIKQVTDGSNYFYSIQNSYGTIRNDNDSYMRIDVRVYPYNSSIQTKYMIKVKYKYNGEIVYDGCSINQVSSYNNPNYAYCYYEFYADPNSTIEFVIGCIYSNYDSIQPITYYVYNHLRG